MKYLMIDGRIKASAVALGCMRIAGLSRDDVATLLSTSIESGINYFDHADIYGQGQCEIVFAQGIKDACIQRDNLIIQTKCGIKRDGGNYFYDSSKEHIVFSVEQSLQRLGVETIDVLLLHRPDALMEPEEIAEAFELLYQAGKVRSFGVSNYNPGQIQLLARHLPTNNRIIINQIQYSPARTGLLDSGLHVNMGNDLSVNHDGSLLDFCRLENITIQAWSPFQHGFIEGPFLDHPRFAALNAIINDVAQERKVSREAVVIAWILRHPANMQAIPGTTRPDRIRSMCEAFQLNMSRKEWYDIYCSQGRALP
jgi:predicted oxidoreductase